MTSLKLGNSAPSLHAYSPIRPYDTQRYQPTSEKRVDYVLVYEINDNTNHKEYRDIFENNLRTRGLELENFTGQEKEHGLIFVKIRAPINVLCRYCEILKIRMPVKQAIAEKFLDPNKQGHDHTSIARIKKVIGYILNYFCIPTNWIPEKRLQLTAEYSQHKNYLFDDKKEKFFSTSVRCMIVNFILERETFSENETDVGITRLLDYKVYQAAYPPHEGRVEDPDSERGKLAKEWASVKSTFNTQPIDELKDYFGMKFALYFAWLGFYTYMLVPASVLGMICIAYGCFTASMDSLSNEICDPPSKVVMCPQCDKFCDYWDVTEACKFSRVRYYIDNYSTILFAFLMSVWSTLYLKLWTRYSAEITHRWGLTGFTLYAEHPRPQVESCLGRKRNRMTNDKEPVIPFCRMKLPAIFLSYMVVALWVCLVLAAVFAVTMYSIVLATSDFIYGTESNKYKKTFLVPVTAGVLNLVVINVLNVFYNQMAEWLTDIEFQRTQVQYDDSLQLKIYLFQFMNYYSSIFYIAFVKGRFIGYPSSYNRIFGYRQEECEPGGCLMELFIQLAIIMIGEQLWDNFLEYIWPHLEKWYIQCKERKGTPCLANLGKCFKGICGQKEEEKEKRWIEDYHLLSWNSRELFDEYLTLVIQYGFVTIFVIAFPLAPLLALLNNLLIEMKLDASKYIQHYRRPVAQRVANIGIWFYIMKVIAKLSIITNACIIATSSNFIPMMMYTFRISENRTGVGFLNYSLAYFDVNDFNGTEPINSKYNVTQCRYPEYRNPPWHGDKYERTLEYWHILTAKLVFVILFQNVVSFIVMVIQWAIPSMPKKLQKQIKIEESYISELILTELDKTRESLRRASEAHSPGPSYLTRNAGHRFSYGISTELVLLGHGQNLFINMQISQAYLRPGEKRIERLILES